MLLVPVDLDVGRATAGWVLRLRVGRQAVNFDLGWGAGV